MIIIYEGIVRFVSEYTNCKSFSNEETKKVRLPLQNLFTLWKCSRIQR